MVLSGRPETFYYTERIRFQRNALACVSQEDRGISDKLRRSPREPFGVCRRHRGRTRVNRPARLPIRLQAVRDGRSLHRPTPEAPVGRVPWGRTSWWSSPHFWICHSTSWIEPFAPGCSRIEALCPSGYLPPFGSVRFLLAAQGQASPNYEDHSNASLITCSASCGEFARASRVTTLFRR